MVIPSKALSLRGVSCRGRGGVSAVVDDLVSLDMDDLDGTVYASTGGVVLWGEAGGGVVLWGEAGGGVVLRGEAGGRFGSPLDEWTELRDVF